MRILHFHPGIMLETGGVVRAVLDLCAGLARAGLDVTLLTGSARDVPEAWRRPGSGLPRVYDVGPLTQGSALLGKSGRREMARHIHEAHVLHLHGMWNPSNWQVAALARRAGRPYIYSVHGMLDDWCMAQRRFKKRLYLAGGGRRMLHRAAAVLCTARAELEQSHKWFPRGRGEVLPLPMDLGPFTDLPGPQIARQKFEGVAGEGPRVLFLSRLHVKKGVESLIHAAQRLHGANAATRLLIAGTDLEHGAYERRLRELTSGLGLDDAVRFLGFVSGVEKVSLYQAADVFILPTSQENFGFVLFEALAAGTPVITTRGADTWPELEASGGAIIAEASPQALAAAMSALLADAPRRRAMGEAGRRWVFEHLTEAAIIGQYADLYRRAVAESRRA